MIHKDYSVVLNGVDMSSSVQGVAFSEGNEAQEATAAGDDHRKMERGLGTSAFAITFWTDMTSGGVDDLLSGLMQNDGFTAVLKSTSASTSSANPTFSGTVFIGDMPHFEGVVGDRATITVAFESTLGTGYTRADA